MECILHTLYYIVPDTGIDGQWWVNVFDFRSKSFYGFMQIMAIGEYIWIFYDYLHPRRDPFTSYNLGLGKCWIDIGYTLDCHWKGLLQWIMTFNPWKLPPSPDWPNFTIVIPESGKLCPSSIDRCDCNTLLQEHIQHNQTTTHPPGQQGK